MNFKNGKYNLSLIYLIPTSYSNTYNTSSRSRSPCKHGRGGRCSSIDKQGTGGRDRINGFTGSFDSGSFDLGFLSAFFVFLSAIWATSAAAYIRLSRLVAIASVRRSRSVRHRSS